MSVHPSLAVIAAACGLLVVGCGASTSAPPAAAPAGSATPAPAPAAPPAPSSPAPTAAPTSGNLVLPADGGKGEFQGLEITVVDVVEKRKMDGSGMMRAALRLRAGGKDETVELTSDDPKLDWNGYVLEYNGGWRQEVQLSVRRATP